MEVNLVKIFNEYPMKNVFTPSYKCRSLFDFSKADDGYIPKSYFNTDEYYYDFKNRNKKNNLDSDGLGDFSDLFN